MTRGSESIRLVHNPSEEILHLCVRYLNFNIENGNFDELVRTRLIESSEVHLWKVRQESHQDYRVAALSHNDEVVGLGYLSKGAGRTSCTAKIGFTVDPKFQGMGLGTKICQALTKKRFSLGINRLEARPFETNCKAVSILRNCGFALEGILPRYATNASGKSITAIQMALVEFENYYPTPSNVLSCPFCSENLDRRIVASSSYCHLIYPEKKIAEHHVLIVSKDHYANAFEAPFHVMKELLLFGQKVSTVLNANLKSEGTNLFYQSGLAAGQTVDHLHLHIVPRFDGDISEPGDWLSPEFKRVEYIPSIKEVRKTRWEMIELIKRNNLFPYVT